ncbi:MAG: hypothetical protein AB8U25_03415 [Rickettsiales endosymbiont of Dermacentor nuttalli]
MIKLIIDQIIKLFRKGKNIISKAYNNEQLLKEDKKLPNIPIIVANKSVLTNNMFVHSNIGKHEPLVSEITQSITTGVTFWTKPDNQILTKNRAKFTSNIKRGNLLKIGYRGRGRSA